MESMEHLLVVLIIQNVNIQSSILDILLIENNNLWSTYIKGDTNEYK